MPIEPKMSLTKPTLAVPSPAAAGGHRHPDRRGSPAAGRLWLKIGFQERQPQLGRLSDHPIYPGRRWWMSLLAVMSHAAPNPKHSDCQIDLH